MSRNNMLCYYFMRDMIPCSFYKVFDTAEYRKRCVFPINVFEIFSIFEEILFGTNDVFIYITPKTSEFSVL
jgi:hypothetical protein